MLVCMFVVCMHVYICLYAGVLLCMFVCMYACNMFVCLNECNMHVCMEECMDAYSFIMYVL